MSIDRSRFKSAPVQSMVAQDKEIENKMKTGGSGIEYHSIEDGKNLFRLYPAHPDSPSEQFAEIKCVAYLPAIYQERDKQGVLLTENGKPKMKEGRKSLFNARIHGDAPKDLVEEYISFMEKLSKENFTEEAKRKEFMEMINGRYSAVPAERLPSSSYGTSWTVYADKYPYGKSESTPVFGRLEIKKTVKERLNKIASQMEGSDDPMQTDPFTDVEDGRAIIITYNKEAKQASDYYTTDLDQTTITEKIGTRTVQTVKTYPLSDEKLEAFEKYPSLYSMFRNVFKRKDFDAQMEGLKLLDDKIKSKYGIGAFSYDKWLDVCDELSDLWPEEDTTSTSESEDDKDDIYTPTKVVTENNDDFDSMTRQELKNFIQLNRTGIIIKGSDTDDQLRDKVREWKALQGGSEEGEEEEIDSETAAKLRIQALKDRVAGN